MIDFLLKWSLFWKTCWFSGGFIISFKVSWWLTSAKKKIDVSHTRKSQQGPGPKKHSKNFGDAFKMWVPNRKKNDTKTTSNKNWNYHYHHHDHPHPWMGWKKSIPSTSTPDNKCFSHLFVKSSKRPRYWVQQFRPQPGESSDFNPWRKPKVFSLPLKTRGWKKSTRKIAPRNEQ